MKFIKGNWIFS